MAATFDATAEAGWYEYTGHTSATEKATRTRWCWTAGLAPGVYDDDEHGGDSE